MRPSDRTAQIGIACRPMFVRMRRGGAIWCEATDLVVVDDRPPNRLAALRLKRSPMISGDPLSRRSFLAGISAAGGGLALGLRHSVRPARVARADGECREITAWLRIGPDNSVVIRVAHAEMGQGAQTGLAMLVAEELECDWSKVRTEFVSPAENLRRHRDLGRHVDRRQPLDRVVAALSAAGRRHRAGNADRRRRGAMEGAGAECFAQKSAITHQPSGRKRDIRRGRGRCGEDRAAGGSRAEGAAASGRSPVRRAGGSTCWKR